MKESTRIISAALCIALVVFTVFAGKNNTLGEEQQKGDKDSLIVWYTDDTLTDYLSEMAVEYNETYGVRVIPKLKAGGDYVESIYRASIDENGAPDLYLLGSDVLEKAYMSGCAVEIDDIYATVSEKTFPKAALSAVTYHDKLVAYPYYFETTALLYNKSYLREMATNLVLAETSTTPENETEDVDIKDIKTNLSEEELAKLTEDKIEELIPKTFEELLNLSAKIDAPEGVETIFKWDVRDIFYNYFFVGGYIDIGGKNGDDNSIMDIYNTNAVTAITVFQDMNQFFSFESADVTYKQVLEEFIQGKLVYATVTTDALKALKAAKDAGEFESEYGLAMIPDLNSDMVTRSLSETNSIVINGYSDKKDRANSFAQFLCMGNALEFYEKTGKMPARSDVMDRDSLEYAFVQEYTHSSPMPKMMETSNYWLLMESTFADVWSGKDASLALKELSEQINLQITGEEVKEEYINPANEEESIEYLDEEALREQALQEE